MKTLYLDCFRGMSGDMTVGALLDAGADWSLLADAIQALPLEGVSIAANKVNKHGIQATQFQVTVDPGVRQPHRHVHHITDIIAQADLPDPVKTRSIAAFQVLGEAEAEVHGVPVEKVHFHEVGASDSIVDMIGANVALYSLGIEQIIASRLVVGSGTVRCDHGVMPVPAPATALLLRGIPWEAGDTAMELVTPTGAALVKQWASAFGPMPTMTVDRVGYGAGTRDLPDCANVLRAFVGEPAASVPTEESISVIEANVDDMTPELAALLIPAMMTAGARDAFITPVLAKKGRNGFCLTVLCDAARKTELVREIFQHSTTLGVRAREEQRWVLDRGRREVATPWGAVSVKIGYWEGREHQVAPEFECCRELAEKQGIATRRVYEAALAAAIKGEFIS